MSLAVPESRVLEIWQDTVRHRTDLVTHNSEPFRMVYPGRPNDGRGADLKDAVIATRQGLVTGDIEIHTKSSGWWEHRHHEDPAYNRVILHVVWLHDAGKETLLQNGVEIPTVALNDYTEAQSGRRITSAFTPVTSAPCRAAPGSIGVILDKAGDARFSVKKSFFQKQITGYGPGQALYRGVMTALGYSKNKEAMAELAGFVPLAELENIIRKDGDDECEARLQARLLGTAGLLPSQRPCPPRPPDEDEENIERFWKKSGGAPQMSPADWRFFKVRPGNFPVRRIASVTYLLVRYRRTGILEGLKSILETLTEDNIRPLEEALTVDAGGYWVQYLDFRAPVKEAPALLGSDRAAEIIVNILLPFYAAYAGISAQPALEEKTVTIFCRYKSRVENSLEKHMRKQLGITSQSAATARRRQGLIHIYKTFCTEGRCGVCPLTGEK